MSTLNTEQISSSIHPWDISEEAAELCAKEISKYVKYNPDILIIGGEIHGLKLCKALLNIKGMKGSIKSISVFDFFKLPENIFPFKFTKKASEEFENEWLYDQSFKNEFSSYFEFYSYSEEDVKEKDVEEKELLVSNFSMIICLSELHYAQNWGLRLAQTFKYLKEDSGTFIFAEIKGDFLLLDANFSEAANSRKKEIKGLHQFMVRVDKIRSGTELLNHSGINISRQFYWQPEIRMSDFQIFNREITPLFKEIEILVGDTEEGHFLLNKYNLTKDVFFNNWIVGNEPISYFRMGFAGQEVALKRVFDEEMEKEEVQDLELHKEAKIFVASNFKGIHYWEYPYFEQALHKIQAVKDNNFEVLGRKAIDLLATHDMFVPDRTAYLSVVSWDDLEGETAFPIFIMVNDYLDHNKLYEDHPTDNRFKQRPTDKLACLFTKKIGITGTDTPNVEELIFTHFDRKFPISFQVDEYKGIPSGTQRKLEIIYDNPTKIR